MFAFERRATSATWLTRLALSPRAEAKLGYVALDLLHLRFVKRHELELVFLGGGCSLPMLPWQEVGSA